MGRGKERSRACHREKRRRQERESDRMRGPLRLRIGRLSSYEYERECSKRRENVCLLDYFL